MPILSQCDEAWYCLKALPKKEHLAAVMLEKEAGLPALAPRIRYVKKTRTGKKAFVEALFPGYVFVHTALSETYRRVMATHGVRGVVRYGENVPSIPVSFIEEIRRRLPTDEKQLIEAPQPALKVGQNVTVTEGPFNNWEGLITGLIPAKGRVRVLLEFLGQQLDIDLPAHALLADTRMGKIQAFGD
jgi:transcriptional antiterminator RfaH